MKLHQCINTCTTVCIKKWFKHILGFLDMKFVQKVYVFDVISKRNNCSFCCFLNDIGCFYKSRVTLRFVRCMRQNPVCATFCIHRRNRHEGVEQ